MSIQEHDKDLHTIWTPLYRSDLSDLLTHQHYTQVHLCVLYWLIWLPLLSAEDLVRLLSIEDGTHLLVRTKKELSEHISQMTQLKLIDAVTLSEPQRGRHRRYYATDLGLYLYLATVESKPPLTIAQLARAYPVERGDLLARLARPSIHLALMTLASQLVAEGAPLGYALVSYQQPWQQTLVLLGRKQLLRLDAALLIEQSTQRLHAFFVYVDLDPRSRPRNSEKKRVLQLFDERQQRLLHRQSWPGLLILTTQERLVFWSNLFQEIWEKRFVQPLAGGITTLPALLDGVYTPIWRKITELPSLDDPLQVPPVSFQQLLGEPASSELIEQFSRREHFRQLLLREAALPSPRLKPRLRRYVGDSLQDEAAHMNAALVETCFSRSRKDHLSLMGTALLTLALTPQQKEVLLWLARHPLLDLLTLQTLVRPEAPEQALKVMQRQLTRLFQLGLVETYRWPAGKTALEQQRYLLSSSALRFVAIRTGEPFSAYFVAPRYRKSEDVIWRQWGAAGLFHQMEHTHALYTCMRQVLQQVHARGESIPLWRSAHEAARSYRDSFTQEFEKVRPDAELVFASSAEQQGRTILLEYDRGTTDTSQYYRKFKAYLDYQLAEGTFLPPILVITPHRKAAQLMRQVLETLGGSLQVHIVLERDLLVEGLASVLSHLS